jgi:hypothetical protein
MHILSLILAQTYSQTTFFSDLPGQTNITKFSGNFPRLPFPILQQGRGNCLRRFLKGHM